jgi:squalene synthase HpnC
MDVAFARELARFGPEAAYPAPSVADAHAYCRRLALAHYENFTVASTLLPRHLIRHFYNVYAYCRWADDLADETGDGERAVALLRWWREELGRCYDGAPHHPVLVALRETVRRFGIPVQPFLDLLVAFEQDQRQKRYATFAELLGYCRNSANPVGRLVLYLCGLFDTERAALSDHVCTALQLTNFWQDVARDWAIGRVYLPEEDRRRFGYRDEDLAARCFNTAFAELLRFEVGRTRELFGLGLPLVEAMPGMLQVDIDLFIRGGLAVLRQIEEIGYNVWARRPVLTRRQKGALLVGALWRAVCRFVRSRRARHQA